MIRLIIQYELCSISGTEYIVVFLGLNEGQNNMNKRNYFIPYLILRGF